MRTMERWYCTYISDGVSPFLFLNPGCFRRVGGRWAQSEEVEQALLAAPAVRCRLPSLRGHRLLKKQFLGETFSGKEKYLRSLLWRPERGEQSANSSALPPACPPLAG